MNILVYANCQTSQLVNGLMLALAGKASVYGIDINHPEYQSHLKAFFSKKLDVDYIITNCSHTDLNEYCQNDIIVEIPAIHFGGFHPDVVYFSSTKEPNKSQRFMNTPTVSAIGLWTAVNNIDREKAATLYNEEVFSQLGYMDYFDVACQTIKSSYKQYNIDSVHIEKHLSTRDVFMYGPLHPKFNVTLSLCFGILELLDIKPIMSYQQIKNALVDPLIFEYYWGCFPPLADHLGVEGSWLIRHYSHIFSSIHNYTDRLHTFLYEFSLQNGVAKMIARDKHRFDSFHKIDNVLRNYI